MLRDLLRGSISVPHDSFSDAAWLRTKKLEREMNEFSVVRSLTAGSSPAIAIRSTPHPRRLKYSQRGSLFPQEHLAEPSHVHSPSLRCLPCNRLRHYSRNPARQTRRHRRRFPWHWSTNRTLSS